MKLLEKAESAFKHRIVQRAHEIVNSGREPYEKIAQLELEAGDHRRRARHLLTRNRDVAEARAPKVKRVADLRIRAANHLRATANFVRSQIDNPLSLRTMPTAFAEANWRRKRLKPSRKETPEIPFMEFSS